MVAGSLSAPSRRDRWGNRGLLVACAAVIVLVTAVIMNASQRHSKTALAADIIDPEGVNPQRVVDVVNDLESSADMGSSKVRRVIAKAKKLLDKKLSIIVDTQTLKTGGRPGPPGPQGKQGYPGYQGPQGAEGDRGPTGPQGEKGPQGWPGPRGFRGKTGPIGPEGDRGEKGEEGPAGYDGPPGPKGLMGPGGIRGLRGLRGEPGFKGQQGAQGVPGRRGLTGPQGSYDIVDVTKKCKEIAGTLYRGVCLKANKILKHEDKTPTDCKSYIPNTNWNKDDWRDVIEIMKPPGYSGWSHHFNDGSQSDMYGGYCSNKNMIAGFTYQSSNNNAYVHSGAFSNFLPNHCRYKQYYRYGGYHCDRPCESWKGVAIYACQMYK